ncbi:hypothetical protein V6N13_061170 [Hibiscus sabdariffa]
MDKKGSGIGRPNEHFNIGAGSQKPIDKGRNHVTNLVQSEKGINDGHLGDAEEIRIRRNQYVEIKDESKFQNIKRITRHVENEELWKLRRCLVGKMESVCSVSNIHKRLSKWGLGEINVQRIGSKSSLLTIEDEDLFQMLEDVNWSYLKENFRDVIHWLEQESFTEKATWLEVRGLPIHCWNGITLIKIAEIWGEFEAIGVNVNHSHDCEKGNVLITTSKAGRIEEVIELEVGKISSLSMSGN